MDAILREWKEKNDRYLKDIKAKITELKGKQGKHLFSYFTYSIHFSHDPAHESMLLGSYHIQNNGNLPFNGPYICLKLSDPSLFHFSGKYLYKNTLNKMRMSGGWERLNEAKDKEEFWLKPAGKEILEPGESITFSNFQVKWSPQQDYAASLMGFTYGEGETEGVPALNQINISGANVCQEEKDG